MTYFLTTMGPKLVVTHFDSELDIFRPMSTQLMLEDASYVEYGPIGFSTDLEQPLEFVVPATQTHLTV